MSNPYPAIGSRPNLDVRCEHCLTIFTNFHDFMISNLSLDVKNFFHEIRKQETESVLYDYQFLFFSPLFVPFTFSHKY